MAISREGSGTYEVQVWFKDYDGTRRKKHRRGFRTKAEAKRWEAEFILKANGSPQMLFRDFVKIYETDKKPQLKLNTWLTKQHMIETKLLPFFGDKKLDEISATDIIAWQNQLRSYRDPIKGTPYSDTYVHTVNSQLSAILNHACRYYGLRENPLAKVGKVGKPHAREMQFWTKAEYLRFADVIMDKPISYAAFETLYWTGIREGELLALMPSDFDFGKRLLRISKSYQRLKGEDIITSPKTPKSNRVIAIPNFLSEEISEYVSLYGIADDERMFPMSKSYLYHEMRRGCETSGVKVIRIHDLRHSHVSLLIDLGFSALAIADRMGHEAVDITYRYAHLFPSVQGDMARALEREAGEGK